MTFSNLGDSLNAMIIIEPRYTTEDARDLSQGGLEQCVDTMAAIFAAAA